MHVLMTTDTLGGVFDYSTALCAYLTSRSVTVTLASMGRLPSPTQRAAVTAAGATLHESSYRLEWMDDAWADVHDAGDWLLELEHTLRPDVIHLNGYAHAGLGWRAPVCVVAHSCVLSWWRAVHGAAAPDRYQRYRAAAQRGLRAASHVVAPTHAMAEMLRREHGWLPRRSVIHNGLDLRGPELGGLGQHGLPPLPAGDDGKEPFVLAAGRLWDRGKNVPVLQEVAAAVRWPIRVAGDAAPPGGLASSAPGTVGWLGFLPKAELFEQMRRAAIFAAPAHYEPFGLAILEAAAAGCALVLGDIPSLRELWAEAALFVDPTSSSALTRALNELSEDDDYRQELGKRALRRARRYSAERMGGAYLALYRSLLAARRCLAPAAPQGRSPWGRPAASSEQCS